MTAWIAAVSLLLTAGSNQLSPGPHARVTLVAEQNALQPGAENPLGLRFELEEGWHIYWKNPGDSGAPPLVEWRLPAGYTAGALLYPAPTRIQAGTFINYGYEHDALLIVPLRVPANASAGAELSASVKFIVCREVCVPQRAEPSIALPVGGPSKPSAVKALFDATRARVPQRAPSAWTSTLSVDHDDVIVTLTTGKRETGIEFFPVDAGIVNDSVKPKYEPTDTGIRIRTRRSDQLPALPATFEYVVKWPDAHAVVVTARVRRR